MPRPKRNIKERIDVQVRQFREEIAPMPHAAKPVYMAALHYYLAHRHPKSDRLLMLNALFGGMSKEDCIVEMIGMGEDL